MNIQKVTTSSKQYLKGGVPSKCFRKRWKNIWTIAINGTNTKQMTLRAVFVLLQKDDRVLPKKCLNEMMYAIKGIKCIND